MLKELNPETTKIAVALYETLKSGNKVARRMNLSHSTTYRMLKAAGVDLPDRHAPEIQERKKKFRGETAVEIARDYANGMPMAALRRKYECSAWPIRTVIKDAGVKSRPRGGTGRKWSAEERAEIVRLARAGVPQIAIGARFNSSQITVSRILQAENVTTRPGHARGDRHGSWQGGRIGTTSGYVGVKVERDDPMYVMASTTGYVLEHRLAMARSIGRPLDRHETVHHINGDRLDNSPANLQLRLGRHGNGVVMRCAKCHSLELEYAPFKTV